MGRRSWDAQMAGELTLSQRRLLLGKEPAGRCPGVSLLPRFLFPFLTTASVGTGPQECKVSGLLLRLAPLAELHHVFSILHFQVSGFIRRKS